MERRKFLGGLALSSLSANAAAAGPDLEYGQPWRPPRAGGDLQVAAADAPFGARRAADFRCNGTDDQVVINSALTQLGDKGGVVQLTEGNFSCSGAVRMRRLCTLLGRGPATVLKAQGSWPSFDGLEAQGGVIEPVDNATDKTRVANLSIDGNQYQGADVQGIYFNITVQGGDWDGPDAAHSFADIYIVKTRRHGVQLAGGRMRATKLTRVRLFDIGREDQTVAHGFYIRSPDGFYAQSECGGATGHGFLVDGGNLHFSHCKAWYADLNGWHITAPRGQYSGCEAQDNRGHGFYITSGPNSLVGCHADSNSWIPGAPASTGDGFHLPFSNRVQLIGCAAHDKNEGQRGNWQRYGFYLGNACDFCQIIGVAQDNAVAAVRPGTGDNLLMISGQ